MKSAVSIGKKRSLGGAGRALRLIVSSLDPRAWLHVFRLVNYYNYSHVAPRRKMRVGRGGGISPNAVFSNPERIVMGDRVRIGARCHIWAGHEGGSIIIGDDCLFGPEVMVTAASYRYNDGAPVNDQLMNEADVVIGRDVWLATRAIVLPGANIGDGAIIAAGAIVKGSIPPFAIAAGQPAKVVGYRNDTR
ncbi:acyltransferase [Qipengyuania sp.]|uniref:acyltransferase n=1 Tax=Qipengyuania sp. TaxID=2004515 RepID=UPI0035C7ACFA